MRYTGFFPCSLFSVPCSLFSVPCSLFPVPWSFGAEKHCILPVEVGKVG
ncbi:hypothetical protein [Moorena sp. SIO3A2]|nr:hypothetical protein [Moorena sp. SIO3A2]NER87934.1 hypothetical protein [Moorena sp. SIO3A2]